MLPQHKSGAVESFGFALSTVFGRSVARQVSRTAESRQKTGFRGPSLDVAVQSTAATQSEKSHWQ